MEREREREEGVCGARMGGSARRTGGNSAQVEGEDVVEDAPAAAYGEELERLVEVHRRCVVDGNLAGDNDENAARFGRLAVKALDLVLRLRAKRLQTLKNRLWALVQLLLHREHALGLLFSKQTRDEKRKREEATNKEKKNKEN